MYYIRIKHGIILQTKTRDHALRLLFKIAHKFKEI